MQIEFRKKKKELLYYPSENTALKQHLSIHTQTKVLMKNFPDSISESRLRLQENFKFSLFYDTLIIKPTILSNKRVCRLNLYPSIY